MVCRACVSYRSRLVESRAVYPFVAASGKSDVNLQQLLFPISTRIVAGVPSSFMARHEIPSWQMARRLGWSIKPSLRPGETRYLCLRHQPRDASKHLPSSLDQRPSGRATRTGDSTGLPELPLRPCLILLFVFFFFSIGTSLTSLGTLRHPKLSPVVPPVPIWTSPAPRRRETPRRLDSHPMKT